MDKRSPILELSVTGKQYTNALYPHFEASDELSEDELCGIARAAAEAGFSRIVVTGTEPLCRSDIIDICYGIGRIREFTEFGLSTGGELLSNLAAPIKGTGVSILEIRLDTLQKVKYEFLAGGNLSRVFKGISQAEKTGFLIRTMTRLIGGVNDDEIHDFSDIVNRHSFEQWFIELPRGSEGFIPADTVLSVRKKLSFFDERDGARRYNIKNNAGLVCLASYDSMNRVRVSADGMLDGISLKDLSSSERRRVFEEKLSSRNQPLSYDISVIEE